jgi:hypothetical protein
MIATLITAAGLVSVLVMALYIEVLRSLPLRKPGDSVVTGLVLLFWMGRIWLFAHRGEVTTIRGVCAH